VIAQVKQGEIRYGEFPREGKVGDLSVADRYVRKKPSKAAFSGYFPIQRKVDSLIGGERTISAVTL
jgi:hypothetical protein